MLARTAEDVVGADALWDLVCAVVKLAVADYRRGPRAEGYATAEAFLERANLLHLIHEKYGAPAHARQLAIGFDDDI